MDLHHKHLLFDFYGAMLTQHQRECFTLHYSDDCSLAEIAEQTNISPQAVSDMLKRTIAKLEQLETKLGLVQRHIIQHETADYLRTLIAQVEEPLRGNMLHQLNAILKT